MSNLERTVSILALIGGVQEQHIGGVALCCFSCTEQIQQASAQSVSSNLFSLLPIYYPDSGGGRSSVHHNAEVAAVSFQDLGTSETFRWVFEN